MNCSIVFDVKTRCARLQHSVLHHKHNFRWHRARFYWNRLIYSRLKISQTRFILFLFKLLIGSDDVMHSNWKCVKCITKEATRIFKKRRNEWKKMRAKQNPNQTSDYNEFRMKLKLKKNAADIIFSLVAYQANEAAKRSLIAMCSYKMRFVRSIVCKSTSHPIYL